VGLKGSIKLVSYSILAGLNRTSVGLKDWQIIARSGEGGSLNRTSVGLKVAIALELGWAEGMPQSNQRGIERIRWDVAARVQEGASIEPAWD